MARNSVELLFKTLFDGRGSDAAIRALRESGRSAVDAALDFGIAKSRADDLRAQMRGLAADAAAGRRPIGDVRDEYRRLAAQLNDVEQEYKQVRAADGGVSRNGGTVAALTKTVGGLAAAWASVETAKRAYVAISEGGDLLLEAQQFESLTESIGSTADVLLGRMQDATSGLISDADLIASASQIISLGLADTEDGVVRLANAAGRLGLDMDQLTLTLANDSVLRLDALGLSVEGVTSRADELAATGLARGDAFDLAVIEGLEQRMELLGDASETAAGKLDRIEATLGNVTDSAKIALAEGVTPLIDYLATADLSGFIDQIERTGGALGRILLFDAKNLELGSLNRELKDLGVSYRDIQATTDQLTENEKFLAYFRDIEGATESQAASAERARAAVALLNAGFTLPQAQAYIKDLEAVGGSLTDIDLSANAVQRTLNGLDVAAPTWKELQDALAGVTGSINEAGRVNTLLIEGLGISSQEAQTNADFLQSLQAVLFLTANGFTGTTEEAVRLAISLRDAETPYSTAISLINTMDDSARALNPTLIENEAAMKEAAAQAEASADSARIFTDAERDLYAELAANTLALNDAQQASLDKAVADGAGVDVIRDLLAQYGQLNPALDDTLTNIVDLRSQRDALNSADADNIPIIAEITAKLNEQERALLAAVAAFEDAQRVMGIMQKTGRTQVEVETDLIASFVEGAKARRDLTSADEEVVESAETNTRRYGSAVKERSADYNKLAADIEDAADRIVEIEEDRSKRIEAIEKRETQRIEQAETRRAERVEAINQRKSDRLEKIEQRRADAVQRINERAFEAEQSLLDQQAARWEQYYEDLAAAEARFQQERANSFLDLLGDVEGGNAPSFDDLINDYGRMEAAAGSSADELERLFGGVKDIEQVAEAARIQSFVDAFQTLADSDLGAEEKKAAIAELQRQFEEGERANLEAATNGELAILDAQERAKKATQDRLDAVLSAEEETQEAIKQLHLDTVEEIRIANEEATAARTKAINDAADAITKAEQDAATAITKAQEDATVAIAAAHERAEGQISAVLDRLAGSFERELGRGAAAAQNVFDRLTEVKAMADELSGTAIDIVVRYSQEGTPPQGDNGAATAAPAPASNAPDDAFFYGGYTGGGNSRDVAGIVHRQETVLPERVRRGGYPAVAAFLQQVDPLFKRQASLQRVRPIIQDALDLIPQPFGGIRPTAIPPQFIAAPTRPTIGPGTVGGGTTAIHIVNENTFRPVNEAAMRLQARQYAREQRQMVDSWLQR